MIDEPQVEATIKETISVGGDPATWSPVEKIRDVKPAKITLPAVVRKPKVKMFDIPPSIEIDEQGNEVTTDGDIREVISLKPVEIVENFKLEPSSTPEEITVKEVTDETGKMVGTITTITYTTIDYVVKKGQIMERTKHITKTLTRLISKPVIVVFDAET
jgi:hypothetical protein